MKPVFNIFQHAYSYSLIYPSLEEKEKKLGIEQKPRSPRGIDKEFFHGKTERTIHWIGL